MTGASRNSQLEPIAASEVTPRGPFTETVVRNCVDCSEAFTIERRYWLLGERKLKEGGHARCERHRRMWAAKQSEAEHDKALAAEQAEQRRRDGLLLEIPDEYRHAQWAEVDERLQDALDQWLWRSGSVILLGSVGVGKSMAASCLVKRAISQNARSVAWANMVVLLERLRQSFDANSDDDRARLRFQQLMDADVCVIDDPGHEKPSPWVVDRLHTIVADRFERGAPIILTSNATLGELEQRYGSATVSRLRRLAASHVYELSGPDRRLPAA